MQMISLANNNIYNITPSSLKINGDLVSCNTLASRQDWWVDKLDSRKKPLLMTIFTKKQNIISVYDSENKIDSLDGDMADILAKVCE